MRNLKYSDLLYLTLPVTLAGCLADSPGPASELFATKTGHITITKESVPDVANESVAIMEFSSVAFDVVKPSQIDAENQTVACNKVGFDGNGTVVVTGVLKKPGDVIKLGISDCTYTGVPISGEIDITLNSKDGTDYVANYSYKQFVYGNDARAITMNGDVSIDYSYDEQLKKSVTARTTKNLELLQGAKSAKVNEMWCADSHIGSKDTGPYEINCSLILTSSALDGCVALETTKKFAGVGLDNPTSGEMLISGAIDTKTRIVAQPDGQHAIIQWDSDGDGSFEGQLTKRWDDLESDMLDWVIKVL